MKYQTPQGVLSEEDRANMELSEGVVMEQSEFAITEENQLATIRVQLPKFQHHRKNEACSIGLMAGVGH